VQAAGAAVLGGHASVAAITDREGLAGPAGARGRQQLAGNGQVLVGGGDQGRQGRDQGADAGVHPGLLVMLGLGETPQVGRVTGHGATQALQVAGPSAAHWARSR
jgi:hypothetical protein